MEFFVSTADEARRILEAYTPLRDITFVRVWRSNADSHQTNAIFKTKNGGEYKIVGGFGLGEKGEATETLYNVLIKAGFSKEDAERVLLPRVTRVNLYNSKN